MIKFNTMTGTAMIAMGLLAASPASALSSTFATLTTTGTGQIAWKNNGGNGSNASWNSSGPGGSLFTTSAAPSLSPDQSVPDWVPVKFSFMLPALAPAFTNVSAIFQLTAAANNQPALPFFNFVVQGELNGGFLIRNADPFSWGSTIYAPGTANLLGGNFTGSAIFGLKNSSSGQTIGSNDPGRFLNLYSDFLTFPDPDSNTFTLGLTSLISKVNNVNQGLNYTNGSALRSFRAGIIGEFSGNPVVNNAVPEPQVWAMLVIGFGAVGAGMRRRRRVVAC